jgi:heme exporter protein CcmB
MSEMAPAAGCGAAAARRTTGSVGFFRHVGAVAWKDLRVEFRSREVVYTATFFAAMVVLIFSFAFIKGDKAIADVVPGILWVAVAFSGTLGLGRAFDREREGDTMRALLLSPASRLSVFLGKAIGIVVLMLGIQVVVLPMVAILFDAPLFRDWVPMILMLLLASIGFAIVGSVFAAMLLRVRSRDVLLPVVLYPILVPMLIAGTKGTAALVAQTPELQVAWYWLQFIGIYDAVFLVAAIWSFESLVIE